MNGRVAPLWRPTSRSGKTIRYSPRRGLSGAVPGLGSDDVSVQPPQAGSKSLLRRRPALGDSRAPEELLGLPGIA